MSIPKESLSGEAVRQAVESLLSNQRSLKGQGYKGDGRLVINVWVAAAIEGRTVESVCTDVVLGVVSNTIRGYLKDAEEVCQLREQEMQMNLSLSDCWSVALLGHSCEMTIDCHDEPFS